ncbi:MAG: FG-GAP-like repeat-containing protein [Terriglobales bacterium]
MADLNGDGCTDAVVTDGFGLGWIYAGNCKGTFSEPAFSQVALGDIGGAIQLVDMNHDGKLDIVTSGVVLSGAGGPGLGDVAGNLVSVLFGDGTGHFDSGRVYRGEPSIYGLAVGDVNGDGFPDVVTANQGSDTASVFLNDGKGGFGDPQGEPIGYSSGTTNSPVSPFLLADVDGNGTTDIVALEVPPLYPGPMQITTMLNDGTGTFSPPIQSAAWPENQFQPGDFVLADFRNTGRRDLLVVGSSPLLFFAPNIGGGKFGSSTLTTPAGASSLLAVGDFNGDGKLDFVALSGNDLNGLQSQQLNVFLGNGDGTFRSGQSISFGDTNPNTSAVAVYAGDFNRDGKLDILALTDGLYEFLGNGDGTFQPARALFSTFGVFALADVNRDSWPDIVAMTDQFGNAAVVPTISVFLGQADGSFQYSQTYTPYLSALRSPELLGSEIPSNAFEALLGDFNGDGNPDLAIFQLPWQPQLKSFVQILFGNGDGTFTPGYVAFFLNKFYVPQFAADVNGDGLADLIELDNYTSSFNVVKSALGASPLQLEVLTNPVTGNTGYGRAILNVPSTTSTTVSFTASDANIAVPSIVIPAGSVSQDFQFSIGIGFNPRSVFTIQAQVGSSTVSAYTYVSSVPVPVVDLEPAALLFGHVNVASTSNPQSVILKNLGSAPLTPSIGGSTWFSETNDCGSSVIPGGTCTVQVTFTAPFLGVAGGDLDVRDNTFGIAQYAGLEGFGAGPQIVPCCLSFVTNVGTTSPPQMVTLTNQETSPLQITSQLYPPGDDFAEVNNCGTLAAGASCQFTVTFSPLRTGFATDSIQIKDNSPFDYGYAVTLTGTGTATVPIANLIPTSLTFASEFVGSSAAAQTITLSDVGDLPLSISKIAISGPQASDFLQTNTCANTLTAAADCAIKVVFKPSATGVRKASVTVTDNASGSPQSVPVSGAGMTFGLAVASGGSTSATIAAGATATYNLAIGGASLGGTAAITCTGAPTGADCSVPSSVNLSATSTTPLAVTVTTTSRTNATLFPR